MILGQIVAINYTSIKTYRFGSYAFKFSYFVLFCNLAKTGHGPHSS